MNIVPVLVCLHSCTGSTDWQQDFEKTKSHSNHKQAGSGREEHPKLPDSLCGNALHTRLP